MTGFEVLDPLAKLLGDWSGELNAESIILRVVLSVLLGAVIGCERSSKRHAAGLRTFILGALAPATAMLVDLFLAKSTGKCYFMLSGASIIGISIISINSVLYSSKSQIRGLTTSVALWACGVIGLAIGAGFYTVVLIAFAALVCSLAIFPPFEKYLKNRSNHFEVHIELTSPENLQDFVTTIRRLGMKIDDIEQNHAYVGSGLSVYSISFTISSEELKKYKEHSEIIEALRSLKYVYHIEEIS